MPETAAHRPRAGRRAGPVVLGVQGTVGGCGASTLAAVLAVRLASAGHPTVLVEAASGGAGLDLLLGVEDRPGLRWGDLSGLRGAVGATALLTRLPTCPTRGAGLPVLAGSAASARPPGTEQAEPVVRALSGSGALLVIDLPLDGTDGADDGWWRAQCTVLLAVLGCGVSRAAAAASWVARRRDAAARSPAPEPDLHAVLAAGASSGWSDALGRRLGLPVLARLPQDPAVDADLAAGRPVGRRGRLAESADDVLGRLGLHRPALTRRRAS